LACYARTACRLAAPLPFSCFLTRHSTVVCFFRSNGQISVGASTLHLPDTSELFGPTVANCRVADATLKFLASLYFYRSVGCRVSGGDNFLLACSRSFWGDSDVLLFESHPGHFCFSSTGVYLVGSQLVLLVKTDNTNSEGTSAGVCHEVDQASAVEERLPPEGCPTSVPCLPRRCR
jgi:hypothetical protein